MKPDAFYRQNSTEKVETRSSALSEYADFQGVSQLRMYRLCEQTSWQKQ